MDRSRRPKDIPEHLLARLWRNRDWRRHSLHLAGGQRLRVLYPGRPGGGPGPDFRDAILQVDGLAPVRGDVEFHREPRGWREHGHHLDPRYNGVVLHVVGRARGGRPPQRQDGREVPVVELIQRGWEAESAGTGVSTGLPLLRRWRALPAGRLCELLDRAGCERFLEKSARFRTLLRSEGCEQALYSRTLEALGYSRNRAPFLELAKRLPWPVLLEIGRNTPRDQRASRMEGRLLEASGLRGSASSGTPMSPLAWCFAGTRPANQPGRRIAGAAGLLARYIDTRLFPALLPLITGGTFQEVRRAFTVSGYDGTLIGRGRAVEIVVNVVLPLFHAWAVMEREKALAARCLYLAERSPRLGENELTREMTVLLDLPNRHITVGSFRQQGLMHLYQRLLKGASASPEGSEPLQRELAVPPV
ncbi:MAG: DUF2851 family protein [Chloroflexi bacterium]|nr:DUF2851 family protein [Chloroflexota bacterium]